MKFCNEPNCSYPVFGKGFCRNHQYMREDYDRRSIVQKAMDKEKANPTKKLVFEKPKEQKRKPGYFVLPEEEVNSIINYQPAPEEGFDGELTSYVTLDEIGQIAATMDKGIDESLANLSSDLDAVMSLYIRNKYANKDGLVKCFTCTAVLPIKQIHCGHYVKRGERATRFLESNLKPQCASCNNDHNYDETPYTNELEAETPGITNELKELAKTTHKATRNDLKMQLIEYRSKLEVLKHKYDR